MTDDEFEAHKARLREGNRIAERSAATRRLAAEQRAANAAALDDADEPRDEAAELDAAGLTFTAQARRAEGSIASTRSRRHAGLIFAEKAERDEEARREHRARAARAARARGISERLAAASRRAWPV